MKVTALIMAGNRSGAFGATEIMRGTRERSFGMTDMLLARCEAAAG